MTNAQITAAAGSVVTARPWSKGTELEAHRGVVFADAFGNDGEYALVWFPGLGDPIIGKTVMPIRHGSIRNPRALSDIAATTIAVWVSAIRRSDIAGAWRPEWNTGGDLIVTALRTIKGKS